MKNFTIEPGKDQISFSKENEKKRVQKMATLFYMGALLIIGVLAYYFFFLNAFTNH